MYLWSERQLVPRILLVCEFCPSYSPSVYLWSERLLISSILLEREFCPSYLLSVCLLSDRGLVRQYAGAVLEGNQDRGAGLRPHQEVPAGRGRGHHDR